jgi:carbamoyl-phosphate synthase small subunit
VAADGLDTRRLVRRLRDAGAMRGGVSTELGAEELLARVRAHARLDGRDLAVEAAAAPDAPWPTGPDGPRVVAVDCGMKRSIAARLADAGVRLEVVPAGAGADAILARDPDGVVVSNGPGDPAAVTSVIGTLRDLVGRVPVFGICLGHQLLAHALGLRTEKLPFGHRGANHPVRRAEDGGVEITVQNHGYAVVGGRLPDGVRVTRTSLFDGSVEGLEVPELRAWSVQYHPEASPGPHDARYLFDRFLAGIA